LPYLIAQKDDFDDGQGNGHGVGLSQYGAKKRAEAGHTY
jgi:peptidoglycan hydrolase-like amidase